MESPHLLIVVVVGAALAAWWWFKGSPAARERDDFARLVSRLRGDHEMAERLVANELKRDPTLTRAQAVRDATQRLARDRR